MEGSERKKTELSDSSGMDQNWEQTDWNSFLGFGKS